MSKFSLKCAAAFAVLACVALPALGAFIYYLVTVPHLFMALCVAFGLVALSALIVWAIITALECMGIKT